MRGLWVLNMKGLLNCGPAHSEAHGNQRQYRWCLYVYSFQVNWESGAALQP